MSRLVLTLSVLLNVVLLAGLAYLLAYDPVVATVTTPNGMTLTVLAGVVNEELATRHGEEIQGDLVGRSLIDLAAEESNVELDQIEFEARWQDWLSEPGTRARIDSGEVTEAELRDRLVTLVLLDQLSWKEMTVKEQEALTEELFKNNQRDFEQLRLRHIVVESQKEAHDIADRLAAGVDFQQLAKRFSLDPLTREQGGDMGWKSRADLTEDLRAFLFLLPTGAASTPIASGTGWHIFLVEERRETYKDCKVQVRREAMRRLRPEMLDNLRERFKVERSSGPELADKLKRPGYFQGSQERAFHRPAGARPTTAPSASSNASVKVSPGGQGMTEPGAAAPPLPGPSPSEGAPSWGLPSRDQAGLPQRSPGSGLPTP